LFVLSEIDRGFPFAVMEGTLTSNVRVGAVAALAARYFAPADARVIGFIGGGEQAKMNLLAMKTVRPTLAECRVSAKTAQEKRQFIDELAPVVPEMKLVAAGTDGARAMDNADILVTATSAQAPLLKAAWMKPGSFYNHVGEWEDEYAVAKQCEKIVCDDWETVKHRTQTLSRMYHDGELADADVDGTSWSSCPVTSLAARRKTSGSTSTPWAWPSSMSRSPWQCSGAPARRVRGGKGRQLTMQETTISSTLA
jgi:ornithine cyclodeaminase/alanine dehydrogenase-like protein (mu-crystallin family)